MLDYQVVKSFTDTSAFGEDDLKFLELSGRKAYHSQGYLGQDIVVAVIDTGVSPHEELEDRLLQGFNVNTSGSYSGSNSNDDEGHGTHVACTIAGKNVGIAPKAKILPIKVLDGMGGCNIKDVTNGVKKAILWRGSNGEKVKIISMSLSFTNRDATEVQIANFHQAIKDAVASEILCVCSAGNTAREEKNRYPSTFEESVAVGAVDVGKAKAYFSSTGNYVDLCQVGVDVLSAWYKGGYAVMSGTSMSTPIVSGIAALLACKFKQQFKADIAERKLYEALKMNTKDLGIVGVDKLFGAGFCTLQPLDKTIKLTIGSDKITLNGGNYVTDAVPKLIDNRFYMGVRDLATITGGYVNFDMAVKTATIII